MQSQTIDISISTSLLKTCLQFVNSYRDIGYASAVLVAKQIGESIDVEPVFADPPRKRSKKRMFEYEGRDELRASPEEVFKRDFFILSYCRYYPGVHAGAFRPTSFSHGLVGISV